MLRVLSETYPPHIKPVRDGWYLVRARSALLFGMREFRDGAWRWADTGEPINGMVLAGWCGLAFDPDAAIKAELNKTITPLVWEEWPGVFLLGAALE